MTYVSKHVAIMAGEETTQGTPVTADEDIGLIQDFTESGTSVVNEQHGVGSILQQDIHNISSQLKLEMTYYVQHLRALKYLIGDDLTSETTTTGDTVHIWGADKPETTPPPATLHVAETKAAASLGRIYAGCVMSSATMGVTKDGVLEAKASWLPLSVALSTTTPTHAVATDRVLSKVMASIEIDTVAVPIAQSWEITLDRAGKALEGLNARAPQAVELNELSINGKFSGAFTSHTQINQFLGGTEISATEPTGLTIELLADNGVTIGSGKRAFGITLTDAHISDYNKPVKLGDYILQDFSFKGILSEVTSTDSIAEY